jgi:hypothetical protein
VKLSSDLRLLTSWIEDFYGLNDFKDFCDIPLAAYCAKRPEPVEGLTAYRFPFPVYNLSVKRLGKKIRKPFP